MQNISKDQLRNIMCFTFDEFQEVLNKAFGYSNTIVERDQEGDLCVYRYFDYKDEYETFEDGEIEVTLSEYFNAKVKSYGLLEYSGIYVEYVPSTEYLYEPHITATQKAQLREVFRANDGDTATQAVIRAVANILGAGKEIAGMEEIEE